MCTSAQIHAKQGVLPYEGQCSTWVCSGKSMTSRRTGHFPGRVISLMLEIAMSEDHQLPSDPIPDHVSPVRWILAKAHQTPFSALNSLEDARSSTDGIVVLEGDWGGQIYVVAPSKACAVFGSCNAPWNDLDPGSGLADQWSPGSTRMLRAATCRYDRSGWDGRWHGLHNHLGASHICCSAPRKAIQAVMQGQLPHLVKGSEGGNRHSYCEKSAYCIPAVPL